ncbi:capsid cement protein [Microbulbifer sp. 2304DJ12-6]|uniref:capsid cement protein n=1 Tax=Microbulbifer sp. 2304DJ12-6 TaxID=3233340 RepID=UPI0039B0DA78
MAKNFVQEGKVLDYTNTGAAITAGSVVVMGAVLGVALVDIASGETGAVQIGGVFTVPKVSAAGIAQGETLTWVVAAGAFDSKTATAANGDIVGATAFAAEAAGGGATSLAVKFTGVPGTVSEAAGG